MRTGSTAALAVRVGAHLAAADVAREGASADPAVRAGRLQVRVLRWWVPAGALAFPRVPTEAAVDAEQHGGF